ncbi:MAG: hypothetical protein NZ455_06600 [Bacteroidia bacterium]|nr:hypothetical protein [Bacteroidia bacterium]MDW8345705.1 hypothetical protein [Bacteroidia bacterium]
MSGARRPQGHAQKQNIKSTQEIQNTCQSNWSSFLAFFSKKGV